MKKIPAAIPMIFILALCIWLANQVSTKNDEISELKQESIASEIYIKSLQKQVETLMTEAVSEPKQKIKEFIRKRDQEYSPERENVPDIIPIKGEFAISQKFKPTHQAMDFAVALGTEVIAPASGIVTSVYEDKHFGKVLEIKHSEELSTFYGHLAKVLAKSGYSVLKGETVALSGNTGNSTAPHLHFELKKNGNRINYEDYIK
jgi:murein DD-endopeptidase MepM/ murein hydrolase activator NlpD